MDLVCLWLPIAATIIDVNVEELWTKTVPNTPIIKPTNGLFSHFALNISPRNPVFEKKKECEKIWYND